MWVMAELAAKAAASFIADSKVTILYEEVDVELLPFECLSQPLRYDSALERNALYSRNVPPGQCLVGRNK